MTSVSSETSRKTRGKPRPRSPPPSFFQTYDLGPIKQPKPLVKIERKPKSKPPAEKDNSKGKEEEKAQEKVMRAARSTSSLFLPSATPSSVPSAPVNTTSFATGKASRRPSISALFGFKKRSSSDLPTMREEETVDRAYEPELSSIPSSISAAAPVASTSYSASHDVLPSVPTNTSSRVGPLSLPAQASFPGSPTSSPLPTPISTPSSSPISTATTSSSSSRTTAGESRPPPSSKPRRLFGIPHEPPPESEQPNMHTPASSLSLSLSNDDHRESIVTIPPMEFAAPPTPPGRKAKKCLPRLDLPNTNDSDEVIDISRERKEKLENDAARPRSRPHTRSGSEPTLSLIKPATAAATATSENTRLSAEETHHHHIHSPTAPSFSIYTKRGGLTAGTPGVTGAVRPHTRAGGESPPLISPTRTSTSTLKDRPHTRAGDGDNGDGTATRPFIADRGTKWTGEWNQRDMQEVIVKLRSLR